MRIVLVSAAILSMTLLAACGPAATPAADNETSPPAPTDAAALPDPSGEQADVGSGEAAPTPLTP